MQKAQNNVGYKMTKELETGNGIIDREHKTLFQVVNRLLDACNRGEAMSQLKPTITFLLDHVSEHFEHEEQLQKESGYPEFDEHCAFHEQYRKNLREVLLQIPSTGPTVTDVVNLTGLISVLVNHVKVDDRKMCDYLNDRKPGNKFKRKALSNIELMSKKGVNKKNKAKQDAK